MNPNFPRTWTIGFDGGDIITCGMASNFGGDNDPMDDGETASGIMTKGNPLVLGCALPMPTSNGVAVPECATSPIPELPYKITMVELENEVCGIKLIVPLIDVGPAIKENRPIDLTQETFRQMGGSFSAGLMFLKIRIIGAAKYVKL